MHWFLLRWIEFQSTLPRGSDGGVDVMTILSRISIHAPSRERRGCPACREGGRQISIHAPSRERLIFLESLWNMLNFNPRSLAGATVELHDYESSYEFQSTLPRGSDN